MKTPSFIQQGIIDRLNAGTFVPQRRSKPGAAMLRDRRNHFSPLAVTKRCIRYDPLVFEYRRDLILRLIDDLNSPVTKIILVAGDQGAGKTSLVRGVIELMGGGQEQLLWFDAYRYADFDEVIQFLIQYIIYVANNLQSEASPFAGAGEDLLKGTREPFQQLEALLQKMQNVPLLIVLDNLEYLVDGSLRLNSHPFKELLNFLIRFPNIKMLMIGERLPYADIHLPQPGQPKLISEIKLQGLNEEATTALIKKRSRENLKSEDFQQLYLMTSGYPWLLKTLLFLHQKSDVPFDELLSALHDPNATEFITPIEAAARLIYRHLNEAQKRAVQLMVLMRHSIDVATLSMLVKQANPDLDVLQVNQSLGELEQSLIRPVLKINYPPQEVLAHLRAQDSASESALARFQPWYDLYVNFKKVVYRHIPEFERVLMHHALCEFYTAEKAKPQTERHSPLKTKALIAEASFHQQMAQRRRTGPSMLFESIEPEMAETTSGEDSVVGVPLLGSSGPIGSSAAAMAAKTYVSSQPQSLFGAQPTLTLADYQAIQLPGETASLGEMPFDLQGETGWESILTEEERRLLALGDVEPVNESALSSVSSLGSDDSSISENAVERASTFPAQGESSAGEVDEPLRQIRQQLMLAASRHDRSALLAQLLALAAYRLDKKQFEQADETLRKAMLLYQQDLPRTQTSAFPRSLLGEMWYLRGRLYQLTYHHHQAVNCLKEARQALLAYEPSSDIEKERHLTRLGQVAEMLADLAEFQTHPEEALSWRLQAISIYQNLLIEAQEKQPVQALLAENHFKAALLQDQLDEVGEAIRSYESALKLDQTLGHHESCAASLTNMAHLYAEADQTREAVGLLQQALVHDRTAGHLEGQIKTLQSLALLFEELADVEENSSLLQQAEQLLQQALSLLFQNAESAEPASVDGVKLLKANLYLRLGELYAIREAWPNALQHFEWALQVADGELSDASRAYLQAKIQEVRQHSPR